MRIIGQKVTACKHTLSYEHFSGLMNLPHLMDNLTVDHRRLGKLRLPTTPQPQQQQEIYFWQE